MSDNHDLHDEFGARWAPDTNAPNLRNHSSNRNNHDGASEPEAIPHELRGVYSRLLTDGAAWSATTVAAPDALIRYAQALPQLEPMTRAEQAPQPLATQKPLAVKDPPTSVQKPAQPPLAPQPRTGGAPRRPRWPTALWAPVAAVMIVALVVAVFYGFAIRFRSPTVGTTASKTPTVTGVHGKWVKLTGLDYTTGYQDFLYPVVAPSDPQVVYEPLLADAHNSASVGLRRTDDGGKTWHVLTLPVSGAALGGLGGVAISPLDAQTIFVSLTRVDLTPTTCPTDSFTQVMANPPQTFCYLQYVSQDGGADWRALTLPAPGLLVQVGQFATGLDPLMIDPLYVQGHNLYALAAGGVPPIADYPRLLMSADGGLSWRAVDTTLSVGLGGQNDLCAFAPTPTGSTIFAVTTTAQQSCVSEATFTLWRSDNAGASWRQVTVLPTHALDGLLVSARSGAAPILYADFPSVSVIGTGVNTAETAHDLTMSADGGLTWTPLSSSAAALAAPPNAGGSYGLPFPWQGGGIIRAYTPGHNGPSTTFYTWTPATQQWQAVTPPVTANTYGIVSISGGAITLVSSNGATVGPANQPITYTFWRYVF